MNPMNFIMNYFIANSRASYYNVEDKQKLQTTALLTSMIADNPLMNYLIIETQAKNAQVLPGIVTVENEPKETIPELPKGKDIPKNPQESNQESQFYTEVKKNLDLLNKNIESIKGQVETNSKATKELGNKQLTKEDVLEVISTQHQKIEERLSKLEKKFNSLDTSEKTKATKK